MNINNYKNYLNDLVLILVDKLEEFKTEIDNSSEEDKNYCKGQIMAYYDTLDIMKTQADLFEIQQDTLKSINLEDYLK
ncbi:hypothetical protein [Aquimarina litoralis]|uniref:hypothetical protein n=1 Tax=Aquimarina litoralis TaxID=584605 RepID=UPI001C595A51|nr:hypothetical protein [Aquimarina litoralis]MBW1294546.1 hypothetical protein [Aquimarina litoralis]